MRDLRRQRGLSQVSAGKAIGIARSTLASIETGNDLPGRDTLVAIATFFGVSVSYLLSGSSSEAPVPGEVPAPGEVPVPGEVIDDPDERALVAFWRGLTPDERGLMLKLLRIDVAYAA